MNPYQFPIVVALLTFSPGSLHAADQIEVRQSGTVAYVSGGISEEARDSLQAHAREFNVKLVLATKGGAFLSDVAIAIDDASGKRVLEAKSDGPWFFAKLPPGRYRVDAAVNGKAQKKPVIANAQGLTIVDFRWDD